MVQQSLNSGVLLSKCDYQCTTVLVPGSPIFARLQVANYPWDSDESVPPFKDAPAPDNATFVHLAETFAGLHATMAQQRGPAPGSGGIAVRCHSAVAAERVACCLARVVLLQRSRSARVPVKGLVDAVAKQHDFAPHACRSCCDFQTLDSGCRLCACAQSLPHFYQFWVGARRACAAQGHQSWEQAQCPFSAHSVFMALAFLRRLQ